MNLPASATSSGVTEFSFPLAFPDGGPPSLRIQRGGGVMLSICRLVPLDHGRSHFQQVERFREIDFPSGGPAEATQRQRDILDDALRALAREDDESASGAQLVLVSACGRIVAVEIVESRGESNRFMWVDSLPTDRQWLREPQSSAAVMEMSTFMCEQQLFGSSRVSPNCFEIIDSLGRMWQCYEVDAGSLDWGEFPELGGLLHCRREDLADQLSRTTVLHAVIDRFPRATDAVRQW